MKFSNLFTFIHSPSRTPVVSSIAAGLFAAIGAATLPAFAVLGVAVGATMLSFGLLKGRNFLYNQRGGSKLAWEDHEAAADQAGVSAAKSYFNYGKSFLNMNAWRHPIRFGASMHNQMKQDSAPKLSRNFSMD